MAVNSWLYKRFGNPQDWSSAKKASFLLAIYFVSQCIYFLSLQIVMVSPTLISAINSNQAEYHMAYFRMLLTLTLLLIIAINLIHKYGKESTAYEYLAAHYFAVSYVYYGYTIGLMALPTGVVLAGVPVLGFIFFHRKAVMWSFGSAIITLLLFTYASSTNRIPYAPLAKDIMLDNGQLNPVWAAIYCVFSAPLLAVIFWLAFYILRHWRLREAEVQLLSSLDPLTGLLNRRSICEHLVREQALCAHHRLPLSVIMVDLDHFKQINDTWGHNAGDDALRYAATVLKRTIRHNDFVGRYGGEEFLIVLPGLDQDNARLLAERIRQTIAETAISIDPKICFTVTASLGMYCSLNPGLSGDELIKRADMALYEAKRSGRDQLVIAN